MVTGIKWWDKGAKLARFSDVWCPFEFYIEVTGAGPAGGNQGAECKQLTSA